jgi:hypothetical protein
MFGRLNIETRHYKSAVRKWIDEISKSDRQTDSGASTCCWSQDDAQWGHWHAALYTVSCMRTLYAARSLRAWAEFGALNYHDNASSPPGETSSFSFRFHSHNEETAARRDVASYQMGRRCQATWPLACAVLLYTCCRGCRHPSLLECCKGNTFKGGSGLLVSRREMLIQRRKDCLINCMESCHEVRSYSVDQEIPCVCSIRRFFM